MTYQIIHTFEGFLAEPQLDGMTILLGRNAETAPEGELKKRLEERLGGLLDSGISGLVVNVGGKKYLDDEDSWELLRQGLEAAIKLGFKIWLYDEEGYPSGGAGGLVLTQEAELEAMGIKKDGANYVIAPLYEGTHAQRNFAEMRRYINVLDSKAVATFINLTHQRYVEELGPQIMEHVEAFFTDEPSLMSVILGELKSFLEEGIPVLDPPDPKAEILPAIPFSQELTDELSESFGLQLLEIAPLLFAENKEPSPEKCAFWESVSVVYERAFAKQLSKACEELGKKLTGHVLFEESPFANVAFQANPFRILKHFQLPGIDLLSNKLENIDLYGHKLPLSVAFLNNRGWIMTETSDFAEHRFGEKKSATPEQMASALSYQFLLGVRSFSYYYDFRVKEPEGYRWVNELLGRMCAYSKEWKFKPQVALYCPYETIWSGFVPSNKPFPQPLKQQPAYVKKAESSTLALTDELFARNIQFILCDGSSLTQLEKYGIRKLVLPEAPVVAQELVETVLQGQLDLYGASPEFSYRKGHLAAVPELVVNSLAALKEELRFEYDKTLRFAAFEDDNYYFFNPSQEEKHLVIKEKAKVYDPILNLQQQKARDSQLLIKPGQGLFASFK